MASNDKPIVAITVGDFNGIGPEVVIKALDDTSVRRACKPLLVGPRDVFQYYADKVRVPLGTMYPLIETSIGKEIVVQPGRVAALAGRVAAAAIKTATQLVLDKSADALVTAPVSKQAIHLSGERFPGQTEMVQYLSGSRRVAMMLVSDSMRVGLVTIHVPISRVARMLTRTLIREKIQIVIDALKVDWLIKKPRIAVLGLNPHASEGGDIGSEDIDLAEPVVKGFQKRQQRVEGPFPADAFFGRYKKGMFDAVVAMYHDQGLIPLKMSSFGKGVNISAGLRIVRTSPDHGTAFDIAGKGIANPGSMIEAIKLAAFVANNRGILRNERKRK